jgi:hypothetical protein
MGGLLVVFRHSHTENLTLPIHGWPEFWGRARWAVGVWWCVFECVESGRCWLALMMWGSWHDDDDGAGTRHDVVLPQLDLELCPA